MHLVADFPSVCWTIRPKTTPTTRCCSRPARWCTTWPWRLAPSATVSMGRTCWRHWRSWSFCWLQMWAVHLCWLWVLGVNVCWLQVWAVHLCWLQLFGVNVCWLQLSVVSYCWLCMSGDNFCWLHINFVNCRCQDLVLTSSSMSDHWYIECTSVYFVLLSCGAAII